MLLKRAVDLIGGGKVDVAIGQIDRSAGEAAGEQLRQLRAGQDLVGDGGPGHPTASSAPASSPLASSSARRTALTTCSLSATLNRRTPAEPRPMTRRVSRGSRISLAWSV